MNNDKHYPRYALAREMMETPRVIRGMDVDGIREIADAVKTKRLLLTGEGSSRLMPAGKMRADALRTGASYDIHAEGALQACEYDLTGFTVFVASNSGRTREGVVLLNAIDAPTVAVVGTPGSVIGEKADHEFVLSSGPEKAVAATKTVVEQTLFYDLLLRILAKRELPDLSELADKFEENLTRSVPQEIIQRLSGAGTIYWSGRTDGVAAELSLKTNEITRKPSDFLEGTYAVHGIEEVMDPTDCLVAIQPFPEEEQKMRDVLETGVGLQVFSIADNESIFPGIRIEGRDEFVPYLALAAGWNLLVEIGLANGIDLDKPERARKVGNEFTQT